MNLTLSTIPTPLEHFTGKPFPKRLALLAPDAAASVVGLQQATSALRYTDIWRSAELSLAARRAKNGVQPPGFSAHNFGLAIDFDVEWALKSGMSYAQFTDLLEAHGWYCHRRDRRHGGFEYWHFNYLGPDAKTYLQHATSKARTWHLPVEHRILERYGAQFTHTPKELQGALAELKLYRGDVDGLIGPRSRSAMRAFNRAWSIGNTDDFTPRSHRTLAFVTADVTLVPPAAET